MKEHYDFRNSRKNPYAERMKNGYTIIIDRESDDNIYENDDINEKNRINKMKEPSEYKKGGN